MQTAFSVQLRKATSEPSPRYATENSLWIRCAGVDPGHLLANEIKQNFEVCQ
ncbi:MAG: hypothetical protein H6507_00755 [Calditrichaeota bacterium]|nr:hypothetical protein [Calditrichota bacterium]